MAFRLIIGDKFFVKGEKELFGMRAARIFAARSIKKVLCLCVFQMLNKNIQ
jgi:hypothetical protein